MKYFMLGILLLGTSTVLAAPVLIQNDVIWKDTEGHEIHAQGGAMLKVGDRWYWYGFDGTPAGGGQGESRKGHVYSSTDLAHWKLERTLFTNAGPSRMDVLYDAAHRQYVLIARIKIMNHYPLPEDKGVAVYTSDTPAGEFVQQSNMKLPDSVGGGDQSVFVDDDGKAYLVYTPWRNLPDRGKAEVNTNLCITLLSDDYKAVQHKICEFSNVHMEAPAIFKRNGKYYLMASGVRGWSSSNTSWSMAEKLEGPWTPFQKLLSTLPPTDPLAKQGATRTYNSQHDFVLPIAGANGATYMYCGDRYSQYTKEGVGTNVWLPLKFEGDMPRLDWYQTWLVDAAHGTWSPAKP